MALTLCTKFRLYFLNPNGEDHFLVTSGVSGNGEGSEKYMTILTKWVRTFNVSQLPHLHLTIYLAKDLHLSDHRILYNCL